MNDCAEDDVILYEKEEPFGWTYGNLEGYDESPVLVDYIFTVAMKNKNDSLDNPEVVY